MASYSDTHAAAAQQQADVLDSSSMAAQGCLEESAFKRFGPLLRACQGYAGHSGCRFRSSSFDGLERFASSSVAGVEPVEVPAARGRDSGPRLAAKLASAETVAEFQRRLAGGDETLSEEVDRAYRIVMAESVRNGMMGMFQTLDMFPPVPAPSDVCDDDCCYEDVSADLAVIAQRLYNDQVRRLSTDCGGPGLLQRRALTAAFIVDFAEASGYKLPAIPETQQSMLKETSARVQEELRRRGETVEVRSRVRDSLLAGLGMGTAAETLRGEAKKWWQDNWKTVLLGAAAVAVFGVAAVATAAVAKGAASRRGRGSEGGEL